MATNLLMPKGTAVWLVENTALTFDQISQFCELHPLEVKAIADGEVNVGMVGLNPVLNGQITKEEIERCEKDPDAKISMKVNKLPEVAARQKGPRYTPVTKRGDKPDAIAWLIKNHPELTDGQLVNLIGTTKSTIEKIRDRSHWNMSNIKPRDPVFLGLCKQVDLNAAVEKSRKHLPKSEQAAQAVPEAVAVDEAQGGLVSDFGSSSDNQQPSDEGFEKLMRG
ncbi:MAG: DUF1013 domain-containing protein [Alphaproteobacteria bacterium]|nr:DUF1013 domain-containing protein [Alphaproteobacteria bacterium]